MKSPIRPIHLAMAYLNMLGFEAYSLQFGSNNLFHTSLTAHQWSAGAQFDFPLEATP